MGVPEFVLRAKTRLQFQFDGPVVFGYGAEGGLSACGGLGGSLVLKCLGNRDVIIGACPR
jgi:hypothetical protein